MKKLSISATLLTLVVSNTINLSLQAPARAQSNPTAFCRDIIRQDQDSAIYELGALVEQSLRSGKKQPAIAQFTKAVELARSANLDVKRVYLANSFVDSRLSGSAIQIEDLIKQATPSEKALLSKLLDQFLQLTRSFNSGYSLLKARSFAKLATLYRQLGNPNQATAILAEALQASQTIQGAELQVRALTEIAQAYVLLNQAAPAEALLTRSLLLTQQVQFRDAVRKSAVLAPIAKAYAQIGKLDQALQIAQSIPNPYDQADVRSEVARQALDRKQFDVAQTVIQTIENPDLKARVLGTAASRAAQAGQTARANTFFNQALQIAQTLKYSIPDVTLEIIQAYAQAGQLDAALKATQQLKDSQKKGFSLLAIATVYSQQNQFDRAIPLIAQAVALPDPNRGSSDALPTTLFSKALDDRQYRLAFEIVRRYPGDAFDLGRDLNRLAIAAVNAGQIDLARQVALEIPSPGDYKTQALLKVAIAEGQRNRLDQALQLVPQVQNKDEPNRALILASIAAVAQRDDLFKRAIEEANTLNPLVRAQGLAYIARELININKGDQAKPLITQAIALAKQDSDFVTGTVTRIIDLLSESNQPLLALEAANAIPVAEFRASRQEQVLNSLLKLNQVQNAFSVVNAIREPEPRTWALYRIAEVLVRSNQVNAALPVLNQAFQTAQNISDPESRTIQVREDLEVDDSRDRASAYEAIALLYAKAGQANKGLQVAQRIQDAKLRSAVQQKVNCY